MATSNFCVPCSASIQHAAFIQQPCAGRAVYGSIHTPSPKQRIVCRVDDCVDVQGGNVGLYGAQGFHQMRNNRVKNRYQADAVWLQAHMDGLIFMTSPLNKSPTRPALPNIKFKNLLVVTLYRHPNTVVALGITCRNLPNVPNHTIDRYRINFKD